MIPGEIRFGDGPVRLNEGRPVTRLTVLNAADRPVQVGSHYHFAEVNPGLDFDRSAARGLRLNIAAGTASASSRASRSRWNSYRWADCGPCRGCAGRPGTLDG